MCLHAVNLFISTELELHSAFSFLHVFISCIFLFPSAYAEKHQAASLATFPLQVLTLRDNFCSYLIVLRWHHLNAVAIRLQHYKTSFNMDLCWSCFAIRADQIIVCMFRPVFAFTLVQRCIFRTAKTENNKLKHRSHHTQSDIHIDNIWIHL